MPAAYINAITLVAGAANLLLGVLVLVNNPRARLNRAFVGFSSVTTLWVFANYTFFSVSPSLVLLQSWYAIGACVVPTALVWIEILLYGSVSLRRLIVYVATAATLALMAFAPGAVLRDFSISPDGTYQYVFGPFFDLYSAIFILIYGFLIYRLVGGMRTPDAEKRLQLRYILVGFLTFGLITACTSFILPWFGYAAINSYDAQSSIFFVVFSAIAVLKHNLFNVNVIAAELFALSIWVAIFTRMLLADTAKGVAFEATLLAGTLVFGLLLIRSVKREIENREKGERLARYLANANARLRELDKQKTEFVSVASHQLRAPIAAIKGYSSMLLDGSFGAVPEQLHEPLGRILESGKRIAILVDDFLNVTRIEQGRMSYTMRRTDVFTMVQSVVDELRVIAEKKGLALAIVAGGEGQHVVQADEGKLKQIFSNLIDNAIKYTPAGSVSISIESYPEHRAVTVKVADTGIGIAPEEQEHLFQKFNRASNANEGSVYGTGLGLYIAREIIKAHNGWIHVSSPGIGKGSTFTVELPVGEGV